ncbi:hypothetical protein Lesp02_40520 [Lentzea sp. NBRC 105346]|uniref:ATP-binding protein n=1 Tax=Lentzea sp. NBRC 105346 TaxID=3032205 RepID=UPI00249FD29B|nr:LuxR C-terminal-related transcriptional regulator [Lentzea sp. NBRC 105346]GLZ31864.1 hypothetical protein Lesp02_40520 [Lentzea sp. NBRC 105346]
MTELAGTCETCGAATSTGRRRHARYCSNACRQRAYRQRASRDIDLSASLDSFIGRADELAYLQRLAGACRMLTLVGPAGVGKTRLAKEFAPDAVWVELGSVYQGEFVVQAIATALGVAEVAREPVVRTLLRTLSERSLLLVLDNCEHMVAECAHLVEALLMGCPGIRVLATSREALRVPGEVVYQVHPLPIASAVELFEDRARANNLGLTFDLADQEIMSSVCARLDGLPLAIELAARLVTVLPVAEVLARLDDRLALLNRGNRTAAERHQSLRAAIEWSYDNLDAHEQRVFRRLSPFSGGFGVDIAVAACADETLPPDRVLGLLSVLVAKSLLVATTSANGVARFDQLESVRLYGKEKLVESGECDATTLGVVAWFMEVWRKFSLSMFSPSELLEPLSAESGALQLAVEWATSRRDPSELPLATLLAVTWRDQGYVSEGRRLLDNVVRTSDGTPEDRCIALCHLAFLAGTDLNDAAGFRFAEQAVELARGLDSPIALARALNGLAGEHTRAERLDHARKYYEEAVALLAPVGEPLDIAIVEHNLAWVALQSGDVEFADQLIDDVLPVYRRLAPPPRLAVFLHTVGIRALRRGDLDEALARFQESVRTCSVGSFWFSHVIEGLAMVALRRGDPRRALRLVGAASRVRTVGQAKQDAQWQEELHATIRSCRAVLEHSEAEDVLAAGREMTPEQVVEYVLDAEPERVLSDRERQVVSLVAAGHTNQRIGSTLHISERTVEAHLQRVRQKLDLRSRTQIAAWAAQHL